MVEVICVSVDTEGQDRHRFGVNGVGLNDVSDLLDLDDRIARYVVIRGRSLDLCLDNVDRIQPSRQREAITTAVCISCLKLSPAYATGM
jgi:hypothetical protein